MEKFAKSANRFRKHHHGREPDMMTVGEARERILAQLERMQPAQTSLRDSLGLVLAEDLISDINIPPAPCSAMDGYAVALSDLSTASAKNGVCLPVAGSVSAGDPPGVKLSQGCVIRIMTGAPLPDGADAVVPFEATKQRFEEELTPDSDNPIFARTPARFENVRPEGEAIKAGDTVMKKGAKLTPSHICAAAAVGRAYLKTIRRPVVAILSTGDELAEPGTRAGNGKIYDSNGPSIEAFVKEIGGEPLFMGIVPDSLELLEERLTEAARCDLVITTAGVSKGDYDVVGDALSRKGKIDLWTVKMRPGKPLAFGWLSDKVGGKRTPHLGLPGNPVSAQVGFIQFGRPAILKMLGLPPSPLQS